MPAVFNFYTLRVRFLIAHIDIRVFLICHRDYECITVDERSYPQECGQLRSHPPCKRRMRTSDFVDKCALAHADANNARGLSTDQDLYTN